MKRFELGWHRISSKLPWILRLYNHWYYRKLFKKGIKTTDINRNPVTSWEQELSDQTITAEYIDGCWHIFRTK